MEWFKAFYEYINLETSFKILFPKKVIFKEVFLDAQARWVR